MLLPITTYTFLIANLATLYASAAVDLFNAIESNNIERVRTILHTNRNIESFINERQPESQTPLMLAVVKGHLEIVKLLLARPEVDVTIPEFDGYTPAHGAAYFGRSEILKLLIKDKRRLDLSERAHKTGYSPLHLACKGREKKHTDTVAVLVEVGLVQWNQITQNGRTCLDLTQNQGTREWIVNWVRRMNEL